MAGRPRLLTPQLVDRAADLRRDGYSVEGIAERLEVSRRTTERLEVSRRTTERALAQARAAPSRLEVVSPAPSPDGVREASLVAAIARASTGDWRAAAWLLERLNPAKWPSPSRRRLEVVAAPRPGPFDEVDELARRRRDRDGRDAW